MAPGLGNKRMQHLRALRAAQKLKREALAKEEEEYLPKELVARVDVVEEEPEKENDSDLDSDLEDLDEEDCEITDSEEQEPVQVNISALGTLIASSQKHGAFDSTTFVYQRGPEPSKKTQLRKSQRERELRKTAENAPTLRTFFSAVSGQPAIPQAVSPTPCLSANGCKQQEFSAALEKKLASKKEGQLAMNILYLEQIKIS